MFIDPSPSIKRDSPFDSVRIVKASSQSQFNSPARGKIVILVNLDEKIGLFQSGSAGRIKKRNLSAKTNVRRLTNALSLICVHSP